MKPNIKTNIMRKKIILLAGIIVVSCFLSDAMAQQRDTTRTTTGGLAGAARTGPKPYKEIITDKAISRSGFFKVHKVDEKYFFELPDDLLTRDILVVSRISKAAAGMRSGGFFGYAGDQIGQNVVRFEKGPGNKIFLRNISFAECPVARITDSPEILSPSAVIMPVIFS